VLSRSVVYCSKEPPEQQITGKNDRKTNIEDRRKKMTGKPGEIAFLPQPQFFCKKQKGF
jgi:hypothetical protein